MEEEGHIAGAGNRIHESSEQRSADRSQSIFIRHGEKWKELRLQPGCQTLCMQGNNFGHQVKVNVRP